jgi:hypothetical protein
MAVTSADRERLAERARAIADGAPRGGTGRLAALCVAVCLSTTASVTAARKALDTARRAVQVLREEGLVETIPQRGTYVIGDRPAWPGHNQGTGRRPKLITDHQ